MLPKRDTEFQARAKDFLSRRDHGVCAVCFVDTDALKAEYEAWRAETGRRIGWPKRKVLNLTLKQMARRTWWDADHVKPRYQFPDLETDLANMQTLCIRCHRAKSRRERSPRQRLAFARLRAARRGFVWKRTRGR